MWCPKCKSEYRDGIRVCPVCREALVEVLTEAPEPTAMEPEFLMLFQDRRELDMAVEILERADVPYLLKEAESGEYLRIVTGANMFGTELYVDRHFTHRALRLLRQFDHDAETPFDEEALDEAFETYMEENGEAPEAEPAEEPVSPEGYRMAIVFLAVFGGLALLLLFGLLLR